MTDVVEMTEVSPQEEPLSENAKALVQMYDLVMGQINAIDAELQAASGGKNAGRRAVINGLKKDNEATIDLVIGQLRSQVFESDEFTPEQKAALYFGIVEGLKNQFDDSSVAIVEPLVKKQPEVEPLAPEVLAKLSSDRSDAFKQAKNVRELLSMFGANIDKYPMPTRRGGGGKRGVRELSKFTWTLDDERMPADSDSLTAISKKLGFDKSKVLRDLMRAADIDLSNPVDPIDFTLSSEDSPDHNSHRILGNKRAEEDADDDEDDDDDADEADSE